MNEHGRDHLRGRAYLAVAITCFALAAAVTLVAMARGGALPSRRHLPLG